MRCSTGAPTSRSTPRRTCPRSHPRASCSRPCPNAPTRVMRSSARRSTPCRWVGAWRPVRCGGGRSSRRLVPTSRSRSYAATSTPGSRRRRCYDAIVLAAAGLDRLGLGDRITERLDMSLMLPMVGQGALAVECRADDDATLERLAAIDDTDAHTAVRAERAFLAELGGGCSLPCAAFATVHGDQVTIDALLAALDGSVVVRGHAESSDPVKAGLEVTQRDPRARWAGVARPVTVYLVGAGPGDPGLITVRGAEVLARADVVVYDRLVAPSLLDLAPRGAELISAAKAPGTVELTQDEINALLVQRGGTASNRRAPEGRRSVRVRARGRGSRGARRGGRAVRGGARDHQRDRRGRVRRDPRDAPRRVHPLHRGHRPRGPGEGSHRRRLGRARARVARS